MPKIIYMRDDGDDGVEVTSCTDPAAVGYVRIDVFPMHPDESADTTDERTEK